MTPASRPARATTMSDVLPVISEATEGKPPAGWHYNLTGDARHEQT